MKCLNCGIEFEGRADAKFCSPRCRVGWNRKTSIIHPISRKAHDAVSRAVKTGKLTPIPCEVCGKEPSEAHHYKGYEQENWLEVKWLCRSHHKLEHPVTDNVTFSEPTVTDKFEFYTITRPHPAGDQPIEEKSKIKSAVYWYDIPISAIPVIKEGWPPCPDYMNGRQYFLWWKNNFEVGTGEDPFDSPVLFNPFPKYENITYKPISSQMGT